MSIRMYIRLDFMRGLQYINIINYGNGSERLQSWIGESWPSSYPNSSKWSHRHFSFNMLLMNVGIHWDFDSTCRCNVVYSCNTHVCVSYCRYPRYVQTNG